jgi:hypothetical protein
MLQSQFALFLFIIKILLSLNLAQRQFDEDRELRYSVMLSEPLESILEWDYDRNDDTKLFFQWNITLINGYSGLLAFSNYDLKTDRLDVLIFGGDDEKLYNGYTDEDSFLFLPDNSVQLTYKKKLIEKSVNGKKKKYTIKLIRPLNTCDEEERNYIIDRGTIHLLTGAMKSEDFQKIKQGKSIEMDVKQMDLTLQRVQLLKSQVNLSIHYHFSILNFI